jgi:hypothetical protein
MKYVARVTLLAAAAAAVPACHDDSDDGAAGAAYVQVERLARPAINEGLFVTNDFLNAVNAITPAQEPGALLNPDGSLTAVGQEAAASLNAFDRVDGVDDLTVTAAVGAFIPDVLRIDTSNPSGYGNALNAAGSPVRGRMITDDVVDITISYLVTGNPAAGVGDNVSYAGSAGNAAQPGHKAVLAAFPYLPDPN